MVQYKHDESKKALDSGVSARGLAAVARSRLPLFPRLPRRLQTSRLQGPARA